MFILKIILKEAYVILKGEIYVKARLVTFPWNM